jgi:hypothetical protein
MKDEGVKEEAVLLFLAACSRAQHAAGSGRCRTGQNRSNHGKQAKNHNSQIEPVDGRCGISGGSLGDRIDWRAALREPADVVRWLDLALT